MLLHKLNAKKRNKKVEITDVAIRKVAYVRYKNFTDEQNDIMHELQLQDKMLSEQTNIYLKNIIRQNEEILKKLDKT